LIGVKDTFDLNFNFFLFYHLLQLKRWERKKCKPNSLPILHKMHVRIGDTVKIISGREKGKVGEITQLFKHNSTVIVKDMNLKTKHVKPAREGDPGEIRKVILTFVQGILLHLQPPFN
jgi:acid phosphatase class B